LQISKAQTPHASPTASSAVAESASTLSGDKARIPLSSERHQGPSSQRTFFVKRFARGVWRFFGKVANALKPGEGNHSTQAKTNANRVDVAASEIRLIGSAALVTDETSEIEPTAAGAFRKPTNARENSSRTEAGTVDVVKVNFEVDGKEVGKKFKITLFAGNEVIEPSVVDGGFIVPPEIKKYETVGVRILSGGDNLRFDDVYLAKFETDWVVGIDREPFAPENLIPSRPPEQTKLIYYIDFISKTGVDTRLVVEVNETSMATNPAPGKSTGCQYWQSRVEQNLTASQQEVDKTDPQTILEAIDCLLQMEGNKHPARFSGATQTWVSQVFEPAQAEVAALYYISYLYTQKWKHADAIALQADDGAINSPRDIAIAYQSYRRWFEQVKAVGLVKAREMNLQPLKDTNIKWYR